MHISNPCALLNRLIQKSTEGTWIEFKENNANPDEIGQYVSALANGAMLSDRDRAYLIFGIEDKTKKKVGTSLRLNDMKKGGENLQNYLSRMIDPQLILNFEDFECDGMKFALIAIEPTYDRPVKFSGTAYIRIGENKKKLGEFPEYERALWLATGRRRFEDAVCLSGLTATQVLEYLDFDPYYSLSEDPKPRKKYRIDQKDGR